SCDLRGRPTKRDGGVVVEKFGATQEQRDDLFEVALPLANLRELLEGPEIRVVEEQELSQHAFAQRRVLDAVGDALGLTQEIALARRVLFQLRELARRGHELSLTSFAATRALERLEDLKIVFVVRERLLVRFLGRARIVPLLLVQVRDLQPRVANDD